MLIGGINTLTLLDYPEKVACIIFTAGCNFRCGFCHNPQFVLPQNVQKLKGNFIPEVKFFKFLDSRQTFLDAVVISGGEPTVQPDLIDFIKQIKERKLLVKLDTNGTNPLVLKQLLDENLIDFVAMDIKASFPHYKKIVGIEIDPSAMQESIELLLNSKIQYEFRTTVIKGFHDAAEIEAIAQLCKNAPLYTLQNFRNQKVLDEKFKQFNGFLDADLETFKTVAEKYIENVRILN